MDLPGRAEAGARAITAKDDVAPQDSGTGGGFTPPERLRR